MRSAWQSTFPDAPINVQDAIVLGYGKTRAKI